MRKLIFLAATAFLLVACNQLQKSEVQGPDNATLQTFKNNFIDKLWLMYPGWATSQGYHKYDSVLIIPDKVERQNELNFASWIEGELQKFSFDSLNANDKTDYRLMQNFAQGIRFNLNEFKSYEWDPSAYNLGEAFFEIMDYKKESLDGRLRAISAKLKSVPAYFEAAKQNIKDPTFEHSKLAINQNYGSLYFFNKTC